MRWLLLLGAIVTEVTGSLSLKGALDRPSLYGAVVLGYVATFGFLSLALQRGLPLGVAYGIWGALGVAGTAIVSAVIFGETITPVMAVGMGLVMVGVLLVELGSQRAATTSAEAV